MPRALRRFVALGLAMLAVAALVPPPAAAHGVGMSQLTLSVEDAHIVGEWELHLQDARIELGLDSTLAGEAGFRDLARHEPELRALFQRSFALSGDGAPCELRLSPDTLEWHSPFSTVLLRFASDCPVAPTRLAMRYDVGFDRDSTYRGYFSVQDSRVTHVGVFRVHLRAVTIDIRQFHAGEVVQEFMRDGLARWVTTWDHLLFLLALLLAAPLERTGGRWHPRAGLRQTTRAALPVTLAFALSVSVGLWAWGFRFVMLRPPWVETLMAASVFAAAWNNVRPFAPGRGAAMALVLAPFHGMAMAGALANLSLPRHALALTIAAFDTGVLIGLAALVTVGLPALHAASRHRRYPQVAMSATSLAIAWLAAVLVVQRLLGLSLFHR